ncbi:hypothetical protein ACFLQN_03845 [Candidatus Aenigmatarchaeota archaeon]
MIYIINNGKDAEEIAKFLRSKSEVMAPNKTKVNGDAYILSDGDVKNKAANIKLLKKLGCPVLGIGAGSLFIAATFGAAFKKGKPEKSKIIKVKKSCPLLLGFKKVFKAQDSCNHFLEALPENMHISASSSKYEFEIIQDMENPWFGIHFNPTTMETVNILRNFEKFVGMWERYHK